MLYKIAVLKNFLIFTGKHLPWCHFLISFDFFEIFERRVFAYNFSRRRLLANFKKCLNVKFVSVWIRENTGSTTLLKKRLQNIGLPVIFVIFSERLFAEQSWKILSQRCQNVFKFRACLENTSEQLIWNVHDSGIVKRTSTLTHCVN